MIEHWSSGPSDDCMPEEMLVGTLRKVREHPWWRARAKLANALLRKFGVQPPARVMDVGCGWGVTLEAIEESGYAAVGLDISPQILQMIDSPKRQLVEADLSKPLPANVQLSDALLALDVIEHIDDDRGAIRQMAKLLKPGGLAIVSVPALPDLFTDFDAMQGHRRRYMPETLTAAFADTGFDVERVFWWGAWMVPILRRMRQKERLGPDAKPLTYADYLRLPPWPGPLLMQLAYLWEHDRAVAGRLRTGTSLFAVAVRRSANSEDH